MRNMQLTTDPAVKHMRCCGMDLNKWDGMELQTDGTDACPLSAWRCWDNSFERIPLCAAHYAYWYFMCDGVMHGDGTSPLWDGCVTIQ
jgi:hypothetical protein